MSYDNCPKCKKDTIVWETLEMQGANDGYYEVTCENCDFEGRQWVMLKFDGWQEGPDNDGQYHDIK
jgi:hypothetical protein